MKSRPLIVGHRGYKARAPENTFHSFDLALKSGAEMLELDVHLTKDKKIVVHHDEKLGRTVPGEGFIFDKTWQELSSLDAGEWFDPQFKKERIPLLDEVLQRYKKKIPINIEVKREGLKNFKKCKELADILIHTLINHHISDQVVISSFSLPFLSVLRRKTLLFRLGVLDKYPQAPVASLWASRIGAYSYHPKFESLSFKKVKKMQEKGIKVMVWTVNHNEEYEKLWKWQVDGIITDEVERCLSFFAN